MVDPEPKPLLIQWRPDVEKEHVSVSLISGVDMMRRKPQVTTVSARNHKQGTLSLSAGNSPFLTPTLRHYRDVCPYTISTDIRNLHP